VIGNELRTKAELLIEGLLSKKADQVTLIDVAQMTTMADAFIIAGGRTDVQVRALVDEVEERLGKNGYTVRAVEGYSAGRWVIVDADDIMIHVFRREEREFYNLERLWNNGSNTRQYNDESVSFDI